MTRLIHCSSLRVDSRLSQLSIQLTVTADTGRGNVYVSGRILRRLLPMQYYQKVAILAIVTKLLG